MTGAFALELHDIVRRFGNVVALENASLSVKAGTVHALLGENGAGKTTAMRIAYGMLRPDGGEVRVDGRAAHFRQPSDAITAGIGMVQQHPANVGPMSVWENVILGGSGRLDATRARREVSALAKEVGFSLDVNARVAELSVASQQRLEILKAIHRRARILILDEPTAILAPDEASELYEWLRGFASRGGTAVVVTHKLAEARRFTDHLTVLRAGKTVLDAASDQVSVADLTRAMIGEAVPRSNDPAAWGKGSVIARLDRVTVHDAGRAVVRNASFEVHGGEIVGIAGVEGAGHHHLLLTMAGRLAVHDGALTLPSAISIVPEDRHRDAVVLDFTLTENAAVRGAATRRGPMRWKERASQVTEMVRRHDVRAGGPDVAMRALSGGNQQKFVLARALESSPALIIAENPTRGLDVRAAAFVRDELRAARAAGTAIVLYSSDLDELLDLADRVLVVHAGSVREVALDRDQIGAAMLGVA